MHDSFKWATIDIILATNDNGYPLLLTYHSFHQLGIVFHAAINQWLFSLAV